MLSYSGPLLSSFSKLTALKVCLMITKRDSGHEFPRQKCSCSLKLKLLEFSPLQSLLLLLLLSQKYCCKCFLFGCFVFVCDFATCYCYQNRLSCMGMTNLPPKKNKPSNPGSHLIFLQRVPQGKRDPGKSRRLEE